MTRSDSDGQGVAARVLRGVTAGVVAGVAASFAMDRFQALTAPLLPSSGGGEPATSKAADAVLQALGGRRTSKPDQPLAGQVVHYGFGAVMGALYGVAAEFRPRVTAGAGTAFGAAACLLVDEGAVPAAGLGKPGWETPAALNLYSLASHLVYGVTAEFVRRQVDGTLKPE